MPALWPQAGALLGFLLWNWSPAKVFVGDVGSTFLGAVFARVVLHQAGWSHARVASSYIAATAVLAIALLDGGWLLVLGLAGVVLIIGLWLDQRVALAFVVASARV